MKKMNGFTLVEVIVAMGLIAMLVVALISLSTLSLARAQNARAQAAATQLAREEMELIRAYRDKNSIQALQCP